MLLAVLNYPTHPLPVAQLAVALTHLCVQHYNIDLIIMTISPECWHHGCEYYGYVCIADTLQLSCQISLLHKPLTNIQDSI